MVCSKKEKACPEQWIKKLILIPEVEIQKDTHSKGLVGVEQRSDFLANTRLTHSNVLNKETIQTNIF